MVYLYRCVLTIKINEKWFFIGLKNIEVSQFVLKKNILKSAWNLT